MAVAQSVLPTVIAPVTIPSGRLYVVVWIIPLSGSVRSSTPPELRVMLLTTRVTDPATPLSATISDCPAEIARLRKVCELAAPSAPVRSSLPPE